MKRLRQAHILKPKLSLVFLCYILAADHCISREKMPIYEYKCTHCNHSFEMIQKVSETPTTQCEACHENTAVRLVSAPGFQLKGTGWYETDFKNKSTPVSTEKTAVNKESKSEKKAASSSTPTTTGGTD